MPNDHTSSEKKQNTTKTKVFFICAEKSGNNIIKQVLEELKNNDKYKDLNFENLELKGVVFEDIAKDYNITQLFSPKQLSVFGIGDILFALPRIIDRINDTANAIINFQPDLVLSVDAYDFCIRVAKKVKKIQNKSTDKNYKQITFWHIVAPSVWAYLEGRARTLAKYYNRLFYLLPFEKRYFYPYENSQQGHKFETTFIGFPAVYQNPDTSIKKQNDLIGIMIGSRQKEIKRHKQVALDTILRLKMFNKDLRFVIFSTKDTTDVITKYFKKIKNLTIINNEDEKITTIQKCKFVIAKSGTNNIEIGALKTPMITYYKTSFLTYILGKMFTKVKYINLFNITLDKMVIPELIQKDANANNITWYAVQMLEKDYICNFQVEQVEKAIKKMKNETEYLPLQIVAQHLYDFLLTQQNLTNDNEKTTNNNDRNKKIKNAFDVKKHNDKKDTKNNK